MEEVVLNAKHRVSIGKKVNELRRQGQLPAIVYGHQINPIPIYLNQREANHILPEISSSHLVVVDIDGEQHNVLVREKQRHPVSGIILHVDFLAVSLTEKLKAKVSIELLGEAPAIQEYGGITVTGQEEIEVECLPKDLPERISVNISGLKEIGDAIYVRDLDLPESVDVLTDPNDMIVLITAPTVEVEEVTEEEIAEEEPQVIERGKKEEEEEES